MATPFKNALLAMSPVACWPLNDTGSTAIDITGNGHDGTYYSAYNQNQPSLLPSGEGKSLQITPSGAGYILVPSDASLKISVACTLVAWAKAGAGYFNPLIDKAEEDYLTGYGMAFIIGTDQRFYYGGANSTSPSTSGPGIAHLLIGRWDAGISQSSLWIDGTFQGSSAGVTPIPTSDIDVRIGMGRSYPAGNADITIQYATIFDRALTNTEIATLWAASQPIPRKSWFYPSFFQN